MTTTDLIDRLVAEGGGAADTIAELRRPIAKQQAQQSYDSLFSPIDDGDFPIAERWLVAAFATRLTADDRTAAYYADGAKTHAPEASDGVLAAAEGADAPGPYGTYPEPGLATESTDGLRLELADDVHGARLAAALEHAHLLVKRPRESSGTHHQRLIDAGWSLDGIVTLSQLIAFLAFQQRVTAGITVLASTIQEDSE